MIADQSTYRAVNIWNTTLGYVHSDDQLQAIDKILEVFGPQANWMLELLDERQEEIDFWRVNRRGRILPRSGRK